MTTYRYFYEATNLENGKVIGRAMDFEGSPTSTYVQFLEKLNELNVEHVSSWQYSSIDTMGTQWAWNT